MPIGYSRLPGSGFSASQISLTSVTRRSHRLEAGCKTTSKSRISRKQRAAFVISKTVNNLICSLYLIVYWVRETPDDNIWAFAVIGSTFLKILMTYRPQSLLFSLYVATVYLYLIPAMGFISAGLGNPLPYIALTVLAVDLLNYLSEKFSPAIRVATPMRRSDFRIWLTLLLASAAGGLFLPSEKFIGLFSFAIPFSLSFLYFERLIPLSPRRVLFGMLVTYAMIVAIYAAFYWDGYGRLMIGAYILIPLFIADRLRDFGLRVWHAVALAPPALAISHYSRYGTSAKARDLAGGSAAHHLQLTMELVGSSAAQLYGGFARFLEQYSLLFLNWVPRDLWPDKPLGLGLTSIDEWFGRAGYDKGYSVSLGMFGEQIYLLGDCFIITWLLVLATIVLLRKVVVILSRGYVAPIVVFDVNLISYIWGGCATFGSRIWFFVVPMLGVITVWRFVRVRSNLLGQNGQS